MIKKFNERRWVYVAILMIIGFLMRVLSCFIGGIRINFIQMSMW